MSAGPAARLRVRRPDLCEPVLERVVAALGARADLPLDRLADAQIVAAAVAAVAGRSSVGGELRVDLDAGDRALRLVVGPLPAGGGDKVMTDSAVPGVGGVLERLVDHWAVETDDADGSERLVLAIEAGPAAS